MLLWKRSWQVGLRLEQLAFILLHPEWRHSLWPRHTPRTVSLSWHLPLQHCQGKVWYRSCEFVSLSHLTVSFTHSLVSMSLSDTCRLVWPTQSPIIMCKVINLSHCFFLQIPRHNGAIPLDSVASSHPHLLACHFSYRILLQPLTNTLTKGPLAGREHVLVCVWNVHQLLHIQRRA